MGAVLIGIAAGIVVILCGIVWSALIAAAKDKR